MKISRKLKKIFEKDRKEFDKKLHEFLFGKKIKETFSEETKKRECKRLMNFY